MEINKNTFGWAAALVAVSGAAYAALLGWDRQRDFDPVTSNYSGPYAAWQVIALALVVGALAFVAGRAGHVLLATAAITLTVTAAFVVVAVTDTDGDGLWPIGAALTFAGTAAATALVASLGKRTA